MINIFVIGVLCGWAYVSYVVPNYAVHEPKQCTLKIGTVLVQGEEYHG